MVDMITAEQIRQKYPNPVPSWITESPDDYCVGGALGLFLGYEDEHFPSGQMITGYLVEMFDRSPRWGIGYAIIEASDDGDFDQAWSLMQEAFDYTELDATGE